MSLIENVQSSSEWEEIKQSEQRNARELDGMGKEPTPRGNGQTRGKLKLTLTVQRSFSARLQCPMKFQCSLSRCVIRSTVTERVGNSRSA